MTGEEMRQAQERELWEFEVTGVLGPKVAAAALERAPFSGRTEAQPC